MDHEIKFGGAGALPRLPSTPEEFEEFRELCGHHRDDSPLWHEVSSEAADFLRSTPEGRLLYGDPNQGGTLPQAWRLAGARFGINYVCLIARGRPDTEDIENVVLISPKDLVNVLARRFTNGDFAVTLFVHDGRMGHCVVLVGYTPENGRFRFHDPWPGKSLLCREFNQAAVDAQPIGLLWEITEQEFERVVVAVFVEPTHWADLTGRPFRITYEALCESYFYRWFNLRESGRRDFEDKLERVTLQPGNFGKHIRIVLLLDPKENICEATLAIRQSWLHDPQFASSALDLASRFIAQLVPEPDQNKATGLSSAIKGLHGQEVIDALTSRQGSPDLSTEERLQLTYLGLRKGSACRFDFCEIDCWNEDRRRATWLVIAVILDMRRPSRLPVEALEIRNLAIELGPPG
jgi:hypothetical protein